MSSLNEQTGLGQFYSNNSFYSASAFMTKGNKVGWLILVDSQREPCVKRLQSVFTGKVVSQKINI